MRLRKHLASMLLRLLIPVSEQRRLIAMDLIRWRDLLSINASGEEWHTSMLILLRLLDWPEFRNVLYFRLRNEGRRRLRLLSLLYPPVSDLHISMELIGGGLFVQHGFSTIIVAKSIGKNFWVNQQVTVGYSRAGCLPVIGDDVRIGAGAIVIGDISIGNRVTIGAGAVVTKSIPDDCLVVGNPARIVRKNGIRVI